jgi:hypothetical protein
MLLCALAGYSFSSWPSINQKSQKDLERNFLCIEGPGADEREEFFDCFPFCSRCAPPNYSLSRDIRFDILSASARRAASCKKFLFFLHTKKQNENMTFQ